MATDGKATWWNATSGSPAYAAQELRQIDALEVMPGPASEVFSGRAGRRVNGAGLAVSVSSTGAGSVSVTAGTCLLYSSAQASQGVWRAQFPAIGPIALTARPASGQTRVDMVVARLYDSDISVGSVKEAKIEIIAGTASASTPAVPAIPTGAIVLVLGWLTVPNAGAITFVQSTARTVAAGGVLPVVTVAERDQLKTDGIAYEGMYVDVAATDSLDRFDGTNWVPGKVVRSYAQAHADANYGGGAAVASLAIPAIEVASRIKIDLVGLVGYSTQTNQKYGLTVASSAGTVTDPQGNQSVNCPTATVYYGYSRSLWVDLPANTATTISVNFLIESATPAVGRWRGTMDVHRLLPGEYA